MQPTLNIALRAARIAGEQVARAIERLDIIKSEQQSVADFITETAAGAEKSVAYHLLKANPGHRIQGQHSGNIGAEEASDFEWFVNPIDGLTNFANALPSFALTIVCKLRGKIEHAVILNPITGEEFTASRGRGAQVNGKRIRVSDLKRLPNSLIGCHFSGQSDEARLEQQLNGSRQLYLQGAQLHVGGSSALAMAYQAAGRTDGCWILGAYEWELEPGLLLLQEAGALVGDLNGGNKFTDSLVAANPKLFKQMLQTLAK
ncbi:inositol monophosphatase [Motiliproteus coralliicola]|uniref:Inositol-1-monophosphatase n=1 Tax=Motiliproteus coralliicola TaxID=2283196 RepID=A0A369WEA5_9GAMM|nr:inositol monophosphatase family protein [Motiliproteus coralliicola]RDE19623.1 inositol monophosphatase [Motiliproteus coralliicola]